MAFDLDLSALDAASVPPGATARLTIPELRITLVMRPATEENPEYWSAFLAAQAEEAQRAAVLASKPAEAFADHRRREAERFADHVIVGWEGVKRSNGDPVAFSPAAARELLASILDKAPRFWGVIERFANRADNFTARAIAAAEALAGNSSGG